jgi:hypothetical protein
MIFGYIESRHSLEGGRVLLKLKCSHIVERSETALAPNQKRVNCPTCTAEENTRNKLLRQGRYRGGVK